MSNKNFMSYDDANNIFSSYAGETKKRLLVSSTMPAPSLDYLDTQRLYVGDSTDDYTKGGIYECNVVEGSDPIEYTWVLISVAEVDLSDYKTTFVGTSAEWTALSADEKAKYILVNITDDNESLGSEVVDAVTDGVLNPVTSNAVFDKFASIFVGGGAKFEATSFNDTEPLSVSYSRICFYIMTRGGTTACGYVDYNNVRHDIIAPSGGLTISVSNRTLTATSTAERLAIHTLLVYS